MSNMPATSRYCGKSNAIGASNAVVFSLASTEKDRLDEPRHVEKADEGRQQVSSHGPYQPFSIIALRATTYHRTGEWGQTGHGDNRDRGRGNVSGIAANPPRSARTARPVRRMIAAATRNSMPFISR